MEQGFIQHTLPFKDPGSSETECLNLNIVCPNVESRNLPVLVWVHGGGLCPEGITGRALDSDLEQCRLCTGCELVAALRSESICLFIYEAGQTSHRSGNQVSLSQDSLVDRLSF